MRICVSVFTVALIAALAVCVGGCASHAKKAAPAPEAAKVEAPETLAVQPAPAPEVKETAPEAAPETVKPVKHAKPAKAEKPAAAKKGMVTMSSTAFKPSKVTIKVGETVAWKNTSSKNQSVTADPKLAKSKSSVSLPKGAEPFDSGELKPGETFSHTFTVAGTYKYFSTYQGKKAMTGQVVVKKAPAPKKTAKKSSAKTKK